VTPVCHHFPMNKTDRLYALAEELRRAGGRGLTGRRLADTFEVSERTVKRDISTLQQAGMPIWAQPGPGGGYVLDASATLPPTNFTPQQAVAVAVALAVLPPGSPFALDASAARSKIWDTLSAPSTARAAGLASRVWVDHGSEAPSDAVGEVVSTARLRVRISAAVEQSLATSRVLAIRYEDAVGRRTSRRVEPILLAHTRSQWFLVAWDQLRDAVRWFRLHRINRADLTAESYRPRDVSIVGTPPAEAEPVG
jgi:predicted DNA-binding transcriptional regulator YafY